MEIVEQVKKPLDENYEYVYDIADDGETDINKTPVNYKWGRAENPLDPVDPSANQPGDSD